MLRLGVASVAVAAIVVVVVVVIIIISARLPIICCCCCCLHYAHCFISPSLTPSLSYSVWLTGALRTFWLFLIIRVNFSFKMKLHWCSSSNIDSSSNGSNCRSCPATLLSRLCQSCVASSLMLLDAPQQQQQQQQHQPAASTCSSFALQLAISAFNFVHSYSSH